MNQYQHMTIMSRRLRTAIANRDMNSEEASQALGWHSSSLSGYLNARHVMGSDKLAHFCQTVNVSADYILGLTDEPRRLT